MKLYTSKRSEQNTTSFDYASFGHLLMGQIIAFFTIFIVWYLAGFFKGIEKGFIVAIVTAIMATGWEYLENGILKPRNILRGKIDKYNNCVTDIILVFIGMSIILILAYNFPPGSGIYTFSSISIMIWTSWIYITEYRRLK